MTDSDLASKPDAPLTDSGVASIVFGKPSIEGDVKTRLVPPLTSEQALALNQAFLKDAIERSMRLQAITRVYLQSPPLDGDLPANAPTWYLQRGRTLNQRMLAAFAETFAAEFERVILTGTDLPTLPDAFLALAAQQLEERNRMVIGPATDGGYYLIGMTDLHPDLFVDAMEPDTSIFESILERSRALGLETVVLPPWNDVDTPEDLELLRQQLEESELSTAPHTRECLLAF